MWLQMFGEGEAAATAAVAVTAGAAQATAAAAADAVDQVEDDLDELESLQAELKQDLEAFKAETMNAVERLWSETWKGVSYDGCQNMIADALSPLLVRLDDIERRVSEWQSAHASTASSTSQAEPGIQVGAPDKEVRKGLLAQVFLTPR